jgi:hypothetical protein
MKMDISKSINVLRKQWLIKSALKSVGTAQNRLHLVLKWFLKEERKIPCEIIESTGRLVPHNCPFNYERT